jgi:sialate O-acetylesterase
MAVRQRAQADAKLVRAIFRPACRAKGTRARTSGLLLAAAGGMAMMATPALAQGAAPSTLSLTPFWGDHGVIQRDRPIEVEGWGGAGHTITGTLGGERSSATADASGHFALRFPARPASETPVELAVNDGAQSVKFGDLLVGDVWLCSGQSNMEYPLMRALSGPGEVGGSTDASLRLMTVPKAIAVQPARDFASPAPWVLSAPKTTRDFSAACYLMARELRRTLKVPVGAIHSSWGGAQARPWLSPQAGATIYGAADMALLNQFTKDPLGAVTAFAPSWEAWYRGTAHDTQPWRNPDAEQWSPVPKISGWLAWEGTPLAKKATGTVWLRHQVTLTPAQVAAGAVLKLGILDDMDMTYVNGHAVGNSFGWDYEREYAVPARFLHAGVNEVMVAVTNSYDDGGFKSKPEKLGLVINGGARIPFEDGWRFSISPATTYPPRAPWDANGGIGVMHNRMVAPLGKVALKGVAWYQGESDTDIPGYQQRLAALFSGWRAQFGADARMLVVQIANYGPVQKVAGPSNSANLREDERRAVAADANAGLVTAIDVGEHSDIHPANKQAVGHRLALSAQGIPMPMPVSALRQGGSIRVAFSGISGGLQAWSGVGPLGFELCGREQKSCHLAVAHLDGDSVVLADEPGVERVRYAWADSPTVNLYDGRDLPVPAFELTVGAR